MKHQYRPEIDGLRAIAVLAVVFYHAGELIPGGYVGVDVFFVISGFLITKVIQSQIDDGSFSIIEFWERRIRRLMPALIVMSATTLAIGYLILTPWELEELGRSSLAQVALLANVYFWRQSGYFAEAAETKPLLHTWSLAVEEQFYLVLPPALMLLALWSRRRTPIILGALAVGSFALSVYSTKHHPAANFFLLPTRAWELLAGSLLAYLPPPPRERSLFPSALALAGLIAILLPMALYDRHTAFPGVAALPSVLGTAAVIHATGSGAHSWTTRILSLRALTGMGLISYSLYLWHWPLLVLAGIKFPAHHGAVEIVAIVLSLAVAALSWRFVETPMRRRSVARKNSSLVVGTAISLVALGAASSHFVNKDGLPNRWDVEFEQINVDLSHTGGQYASSQESSNVTPKRIGRISEEDSTGGPDFMLWGDSHGMALAHVFDRVGLESNQHGLAFLQDSQAPLPGVCRSREDRPEFARDREFKTRSNVMRLLEENPPRRLVLVARWLGYCNGPNPIERFPQDLYFLSERSQDTPSRARSLSAIRSGLTQLAAQCRQAETQLVVILQPPDLEILQPARRVADYLANRQPLPERWTDLESHRAALEDFRTILDAPDMRDVLVLDPLPLLLAADGEFQAVREGTSLYRDNDHLSYSGAETLRPLIETALGVD